jgi:hypothetical protein
MQKFKSIFKTDLPVIGMIHLQSLPGTPGNVYGSAQIIDKALKEAELLKKAGIDSIMIENMHDVPYLNRSVGHEISALMAVIAYEIKKRTHLPTGMQILAGANIEALAASKAAGIDFIRAEGFVFAHVADEGLMNAQAGELLRYRRQIAADHIAVFTDIKKKHSSHIITRDISLLDTAKAAQFCLSDGVVVTGNHTGMPASVDDLEALNRDLDFPVFVGSGLTLENVASYAPLCDAMIVGSYFKDDGYWENKLNYDRVAGFMDRVKELLK